MKKKKKESFVKNDLVFILTWLIFTQSWRIELGNLFQEAFSDMHF
jgi:hypothetical protein